MKKQTFAIVLLLTLTVAVSGQEKKYTPTPENLKNRAWFQDARFGLFIHWGVYSVLGDGEWVMNNQQIPIKTYEKLPTFFNPIEFNPAEWVQMAKDAGMKYITITRGRKPTTAPTPPTIPSATSACMKGDAPESLSATKPWKDSIQPVRISAR